MRSKASDFYIYGLTDEREVIFYIGYGRKNRFKQHWKDFIAGRETNNFKKKIFKRLLSLNKEYGVLFLEKDLSFKQALEQEKFHIQRLGTKYDATGILCNLTKGGDGGYTPNNRNFGNDEIMKAKLMSHIERNVRGKPLNSKHVEALREAALRRTVHGNSGNYHKEESRKTISEKMIGNKNNAGKYKPETADKISLGLKRFSAIEDKRVVSQNMSSRIIEIHNSQKQCQIDLNLPNANCVSAVLWNKQKTAHGYQFFFYDKSRILQLIREGYKFKSLKNN